MTPPCTNLIIKSKISEVIYSVPDVDTRVKNKSFKILKSKKIKVRKGLLEEKDFVQFVDKLDVYKKR